MNIQNKSVGFLIFSYFTLIGMIGCNLSPSTTGPNSETDPKSEEMPLPESEQSTPIDSLNSSVGALDPSVDESVPIVKENSEWNQELESKKIELAILREKERIRKAKLTEVAPIPNPVPVQNTQPKIEEPPSVPVVEVSYSKSLDLKLQDQRLIWRAVGPGDYNISVTRAVDNQVVYNGSSEDTAISYSTLELDESIRYSVKVQHVSKKISEKKSFSLIARGTMLNPTCK
jgi:hypothetical protein